MAEKDRRCCGSEGFAGGAFGRRIQDCAQKWNNPLQCHQQSKTRGNTKDGAPLSAYLYFENIRNFIVALQDMGLPTFEASDLERGGKSFSVVDSVLALKSQVEGSQVGKSGSSKFGGMTRPGSSSNHFMRKSSDPFMNSISRAQTLPEKSSDDLSSEDNFSGDMSVKSMEMKSSHSLNMLIHSALSNKRPEEVPLLVETILNKVMQEFQQCIANQKKMEVQGNASKSNMEEANIKENGENESKESHVKQQEKEVEMRDLKERLMLMEQRLKLEENSFQEEHFLQQHRENPMEEIDLTEMEEKAKEERLSKQHAKEIKKELKQKALNERLIRQQLIFDRQQKEIQELKYALRFTRTGVEYLKRRHSEEFGNLGNKLCALASAASGYHKVLEENRKLYNQIQDLKGNIRVYCRVRPFLPGQMSTMSSLGRIDDQNITIFTQSKTGKDARRTFTFNKVFGPSATQEEIFSDTQPLIRSVLDGYNVCIFAYGQTGSGKTHTMSGPKELNEKTVGVNYRALNDLFHLSEQRKDTFIYEISVQMVEIYNEQVRDLLNDGLNKRLEIRNCSNKGLSVPDANLVPVRSTEEVIEIMNLGWKNRAISCTAMNDHSSRSHSCLSIHVQGKELTSGNTLRGCMHLVDLAGSERVDKSQVKGDRLKEAQHINKSLSALGDVIASLAQKNAHVPYRNSKLTQLLQDSLGGQAKTLMFVHISPEVDALGETLSTLKFAERVATVELGAAKINKDNSEVKDLKEQIAALKMELARKGAGVPLRPTVCIPELLRLKTDVASLELLNDEEDEMGHSTSSRQSMEEARDIEVRSNSIRQKKPEEPQVSMESPWSNSSPGLGEEDMKTGSGEWVDKVVVNNRSRTPSKEDDTMQEQMLFQRYLNEMRVFPEQHASSSAAGKKGGSHELQQNRFYPDLEDFENSASDSSEVELRSRLSVSKIPGMAEVGLSKLKRPQTKGTKSMDGRNSSHGNIPSPSRKVLNGATKMASRTMRQPVSGDGKRSGIKSSAK
ncbi:kinesin-like protein KIN-14P isoform X2 [Phalaenopsis equestris]|uniref:kinesin-like protein KIN-14P isoform X2 n=1 Tax=Phalaenopsis equestris TaxID=78828 RepID=UPI0009E47F44|nr:kinesin-like protein KIN-14P isoform X2 [Phalaenopsis equestris]